MKRDASWTQRVSPVTWAVSVGLWLLGGSLTWLGIVGDLHGWWADRPFLTNLFSGAVGASFGIPVALVIIGEVAWRQRAHADRVSRLAQAKFHFASLGEGHRALLTRASRQVRMDPGEAAMTLVDLRRVQLHWQALSEAMSSLRPDQSQAFPESLKESFPRSLKGN
jgi:hypothetical protein